MNPRKKALIFEWSEDMEKDFKELKAEFTAGKIDAFPDFDSREPFILTTDWFALNCWYTVSKTRHSGAF